MILETILDVVFSGIIGLLELLPAFDWAVPTEWVGFLTDALSVVLYFLPVSTIKSLFSLIIVITVFRCSWSFGLFLKSLIPFF